LSSLVYLIVPLDLPHVPKYSHLPVANIYVHVPKFDGSPWLVVNFLESFINYVIDTNIVFEDVLMKSFALSMQGFLAGKWCSRLKPQEIKSFPQLMKRFQKDWIAGYEEVEDVQVFIGLQGRMLEKVDNLVIEYGECPSHDTLMEIK
jgi:hypothetical protein